MRKSNWIKPCFKSLFATKQTISGILATGPMCPMQAFNPNNAAMPCMYVCACSCMCVCVSAPGRLAVYWVSNTELTSCQGLNVWSASRTMWPAFRERERGQGRAVVILESMRRLSPHHHFFPPPVLPLWWSGWSVCEFMCVCAMWRLFLIQLFFLYLFVRLAAWHHLTLCWSADLWLFSVEKNTSSLHVKLLKSFVFLLVRSFHKSSK